MRLPPMAVPTGMDAPRHAAPSGWSAASSTNPQARASPLWMDCGRIRERRCWLFPTGSHRRRQRHMKLARARVASRGDGVELELRRSEYVDWFSQGWTGVDQEVVT